MTFSSEPFCSEKHMDLVLQNVDHYFNFWEKIWINWINFGFLDFFSIVKVHSWLNVGTKYQVKSCEFKNVTKESIQVKKAQYFSSFSAIWRTTFMDWCENQSSSLTVILKFSFLSQCDCAFSMLESN